MYRIRRGATGALAAILPIAAAAVLIALAATSATAATAVAVFNFQMKSETPEWRWLEKGIADRITTDFVQDRGLAVVARDEMQVLAQKINWVPEMAVADPERMKDVKQQLRIAFLATGVYTVERDQIVITGQIVEVEGRKEVARKEVRGKVADVLELQRRLSAELLAWFSKKKPEDVLAQLPVWTRSLPAAKALYEGMDLYDQGRYDEGWLKFRQASRADPGYVEAQYWVGKMYYFLNRYDHARRALEKFVYLNAVHPRLGDAVTEYVHTYESLNLPPETLLDLYATMVRRLPEATFHGEIFLPGHRAPVADWAAERSALLMLETGRPGEAVQRLAPIVQDIIGPAADPTASLAIERQLAITGEAVDPDIVHGLYHFPVAQFSADGAALVVRLTRAVRLIGKELGAMDKWATFDSDSTQYEFYVEAPSGYVIKALQFFPVSDGDAGTVELALFAPMTMDMTPLKPPVTVRLTPARTAPLADAATQGIAENTLPRTGLLLVRATVRLADARSGPVVFRGMRVVPRLEKTGPCGAIDVGCDNTPMVRVEVDGVLTRRFL